MILAWTENAWDDYLYWQQTDKKTLSRIHKLIQNIRRTPFEGLGDPEPLKHQLSGLWSRRIDREHRIVYHISDTHLTIIQCRYHY